MSMVEVVLRSLGYGLGYLAVFAVTMLALSLIVTWADESRLRARREARSTSNPPSAARRLKARMRRLEQPTLLFTPAKELGFSKLGGNPELPQTAEWPMGAPGPRAFLAQIELKAFRAHGGPEWVPTEGFLYAFCDLEGYGDPGQVRVLYSLDAPLGETAAPAGARSFPERRIAFETYASIPSLDWLGIDVAKIEVDPEELDDLADAPDRVFGDELQHRLGGYPSEIQDERMAITCERIRRGLSTNDDDEIAPAIERAARQWRLLLQIDSDPALKMNWGDGGRLYVFVREKEALAGDFSKTITIFQTY